MTESAHIPPLRRSWQILGEVALPVAFETDDVLRTWLSEILDPLRLHTDFLHKVLNSVEESTARVMQPGSGMTFGRVHLSIFAPDPPWRKSRTWGFFLIERIDGLRQQENHPGYAVEVYLYLEG
jgi:hypothetical protein